jgi:DHA2 family multidrug resistance protein
MAPSGIGSVIAISLFARWANDIDNRIFIAIGAALVAYSMWLMIGYNLQAEQDLVVWANLIGGAGMILFMSPMSAMAFSTLPHSLLNEGGTFFYLARNLGGSFAIAISQAMLIRTSTAMHMSLSEHVTAYDSRITDLPVATELAATVLNNEITRQASMVGYIDIFLLWLVVILAAAPFILLLRSRAHTETSVTVME